VNSAVPAWRSQNPSPTEPPVVPEMLTYFSLVLRVIVRASSVRSSQVQASSTVERTHAGPAVQLR